MMLNICLDVLLTEKSQNWFSEKVRQISEGAKDSQFYLAFSSVPRRTSKGELSLNEEQLRKLRAIQPAFNPSTWTIDELCRVTLMTCLPSDSNQAILEKLFNTADMRESVALYKGLSFLKNAEDFKLRAIDGLRTNITPVFDAIAMDNPFASNYFEEPAWNQMVLKAIFMERPIYRIYGVDQGRNKTLALILQDYAHERWSAHRSVSPELWRNVSGYVDDALSEDLERIMREGTPLERFAAAKVLAACDLGEGKAALERAEIEAANLPSWEEIGASYEGQRTI
ncbi:MAG: hypothetical protein ACI81P_000901 [Neolewinella sp.]|jgi:hypothetical protein